MSTLASAERRSPPRIAVIGGGITGLAAAHRLGQLLTRAEICLFESASRWGGVLETIERDGFLVERSADNFLTTRPAGVALCRRLGMADDLLPTDESRRRAMVVRQGRLLPVPAGFYLMSPRLAWPVLTSPILSAIGKLRLFAEPLVPPRRRVERAASNDHQQANNPCDDESVADFVRRRLGREVYERLVQPLVAGIYTADAERLSMAATMPQFLEYERRYGSLLRATLAREAGNEECRLRNVDFGLWNEKSGAPNRSAQNRPALAPAALGMEPLSRRAAECRASLRHWRDACSSTR